MKPKKQSKLSISNLLHWIKTSNPTVDEFRMLEVKITKKKVNREGVSDNELNDILNIIKTCIENLESDVSTLTGLEEYEDKVSMPENEISIDNHDQVDIDTSPLVPDVEPSEIIKLPKDKKRELFDSLRAQITSYS